MASSFARYSGLLENGYVTNETKAACGRLIIADARFNGLMTFSLGLGYKEGPVTRPEWAARANQGRAARRFFDDAWATFLSEMTPETSEEADERLRAGVQVSIGILEELVETFPEKDRMVDW